MFYSKAASVIIGLCEELKEGNLVSQHNRMTKVQGHRHLNSIIRSLCTNIYILSSAVTESHKYVKSCVYSNIQKEFLRVYYYHYYLCKYCLCMPVLDGKRGDGVGAGQGMCHMRRSKDNFQCFV